MVDRLVMVVYRLAGLVTGRVMVVYRLAVMVGRLGDRPVKGDLPVGSDG